MFSKMMDAVFGCRHARYSFPLTIRANSRRATSASRVGTYVVCLDCGREFAYDWQEMRVAQIPSTKSPRPLVTKEAA